MVLTMAAVAAAKDIPAHNLRVNVRMIPPDNGNDGVSFQSEVYLSPQHTPRERRILYNSARTCEVYHLLRGPIRFQESLHIGEDGV